MAGQKAVSSHQGAQTGKVGKGRVCGHNQNNGGSGQNSQVEKAAPLENRPAQLRDEGLHFRGNRANLAGQESDSQKQSSQNRGHPDERDPGIMTARLFECGNAVRHGFNPGQGRCTAGKGVQ